MRFNKTGGPTPHIAEVVDASHDLLLAVASDLDSKRPADRTRAGPGALYASGRAGVAQAPRPARFPTPSLVRCSGAQHVPPRKEAGRTAAGAGRNLDASTFLGRLALIASTTAASCKGRLCSGSRQVDGGETVTTAKITELLATEAWNAANRRCRRRRLVAVAGLPGEILIGDTLAASANPLPCPGYRGRASDLVHHRLLAAGGQRW